MRMYCSAWPFGMHGVPYLYSSASVIAEPPQATHARPAPTAGASAMPPEIQQGIVAATQAALLVALMAAFLRWYCSKCSCGDVSLSSICVGVSILINKRTKLYTQVSLLMTLVLPVVFMYDWHASTISFHCQSEEKASLLRFVIVSINDAGNSCIYIFICCKFLY